MSETQPLADAFSNREDAAEIFPYLANANRVSSRFRVRGGSCLNTVAATQQRQQPKSEQRSEPQGEPAPTPEQPSPRRRHAAFTSVTSFSALAACEHGHGHGHVT